MEVHGYSDTAEHMSGYIQLTCGLFGVWQRSVSALCLTITCGTCVATDHLPYRGSKCVYISKACTSTLKSYFLSILFEQLVFLSMCGGIIKMTDDKNKQKKHQADMIKINFGRYFIFSLKSSLYIFPLRHYDRPEITGVAEARLAGNNEKVGASTASWSGVSSLTQAAYSGLSFWSDGFYSQIKTMLL